MPGITARIRERSVSLGGEVKTMKTLPSCLCILGFTAAAVAGTPLMDQIGPADGTNIDAANILANQIFEASFSGYNISVADEFDNAGSDILTAEFVMGGWNGYAGPTGVSGWQVNVHSSTAAVCSNLVGDVSSQDFAAGDATIEDSFGGLTGYALIGLDCGGQSAAGGSSISIIPTNEFGVNGQTGMAISVADYGAFATQNNPNGGFGFGDCQDTGENAAIRLTGGAGDPCSGALAAVCAADVSGADGSPDGAVNVSDLLAVIANWGQSGDGTFRPVGDCAPMPNGDCQVNVSDLLAVIGDWGSDCVERGSCCYSDGSCVENVAEGDCNGDWGGAGSDCSSCTSGACCAPDGTCSTATANGCDGNYQGDGTDCATTDCPTAADNDNCADAIEIFDGDVAVNTNGATTDGLADFLACENAGVEDCFNDIWFTYTATCDGDLTLSTCDTVDFDSRIAVYDACGGTMIACNDDGAGCGLFTSTLVMATTSGDSYTIRLGGFGDGATGSGTMSVSCAAYEAGACCIGATQCVDGLLPPDCVAFGGTHQGGATDCATVDCDPTPANDTCEGATEAVLGANAFDTTFANPEWADPNEVGVCDGTFMDWGGSADVFLTYTPDQDGSLSITTCDATSFDTSIAVYNTCAGDGTHNIACNGDSTGQTDCQSYYSAIDNLPVSAGTPVIIRCGGWQGATGAGTLTLTFTGGNETAACCVSGACAGDVTNGDCTQLGGLWLQGETCATASCPQTFDGCDGSEDINEADLTGPNGYACSCSQDGDDALEDCNPGLNGDGTMTSYTMGYTVCGDGSVFVDVTGGTFRDTDWWDDNGGVDAPGTYSLSVGSGAAQLLGLVDLDAGAFIDYSINTAGYVADPYDVAVTSTNNCIWIGPSDWNTAWTCDSGLAAYVFSVN